MRELSHEEQQTLSAAEGWFELGAPREAESELAGLGSAAKNHPGVLELRWQIRARAKEWDACVDIAKTITQTAPEEALGWVQLSFALHELKRTQEAWANLIAVVEQFPKDVTMRYNLACYACQLGDLPETRRWLKKSFTLGRKKETKQMALEDIDLKPLWAEIAEF